MCGNRLGLTKRNALGKLVCAPLAMFFLAGCLFGPEKYGRRGFVTPDMDQYRLYLNNARTMSQMVSEYCDSCGEPDLIKIGHSGGYFAWKDKPFIIDMGCFGKSAKVDGVPKDMKIKMGLASVEDLRRKTGVSKKSDGEYTIDKFDRASGDSLRYEFVISTRGSEACTLAIVQQVKFDLCEMIRSDYALQYPAKSRDGAKISFPTFSVKGKIIEGTACVIDIEVCYLNYDASRRKGVMAVRLNGMNFEEARKWMRSNIETLVRDKNIALVTGQIPPAARFYLEGERLRDGDIFEVEFESE